MGKKRQSTKEKVFSTIRKTFDKHPIIKFISIILLIVAYSLFVSKSHGIREGLLVSTLTWSFFVLCTPIADAGILIDFPMRLITGIKMIYSEIIVWVIAIGLNIFVFLNYQNTYNTTILLSLFKKILIQPFPYWSIIILSAIGTFFSVYIADNFTDSKKGTKTHTSFLIKHKIIIFTFLIIFVIFIYDFLLNSLGVQIPLI
ncbi:MAG: hypothetical protein PF542_04735 [Nanoarchaeota archaeon]|jgi:hypothetical protein|nr:hypothetical protein [Nanoarchaeota archaeon]